MAFVDKTWELLLLLLLNDLAILGDEHDEEEEEEDEGAVIKPLIIWLLFNLSAFVVVVLTLELEARRLSLRFCTRRYWCTSHSFVPVIIIIIAATTTTTPAKARWRRRSNKRCDGARLRLIIIRIQICVSLFIGKVILMIVLKMMMIIAIWGVHYALILNEKTKKQKLKKLILLYCFHECEFLQMWMF